MRPLGIVVVDVSLHDVIEVLRAEAGEMFPAFTLQRSIPVFCIDVRHWCLELRRPVSAWVRVLGHQGRTSIESTETDGN